MEFLFYLIHRRGLKEMFARKYHNNPLSVEDECIRSLDNSIKSRNADSNLMIFPNNYFVEQNKTTLLFSTITQIIYLLSRKRQNNSLHMHMVMYLSDQINHFLLNRDSVEEFSYIYMVINAELVLKDCYKVMTLAEEKTRNLKDVEKVYLFKDEKRLIKELLELGGVELYNY